MALVDRPTVLLTGYSAWLVARLLRQSLPQAALDFSPERRQQALKVLEELEAAGSAWHHDQLTAASAVRSAVVPIAASSSQWEHAMTTAEAAGVLQVTPRRVGQLAQQLGGRKRAGVWQFERAQVLAYREDRSA